MVEGGDAMPCREPDGEACNGVGLDGNEQPQQPVEDEEKEALLNKLNLPRHLPSIVDIKRALPSHVFDPHVSTSMYYVAKDALLVGVTFWVAEWLWSSSVLPTWCYFFLLPAYWLLQGTFFTAVFVVGHDADHSSFSHHDWLNNIVGNVFHTFLLCPFYCWKLSHRHHHKNTGNMDKDEVYYPMRRKQDMGSYTIPGFGLGIGWFVYLLVGYGPRPVNHFNPWHPMLRRHAVHCLLSVSLIVAWAAVLCHYAMHTGFTKLVVLYVVPEMVFASFTVIITFLHHTEEEVPWYSDDMWDNVRGQLSSVDRHYGWCHDIIHNIGTHQIHHLFSKVPHYHLEEATRVFREKFPRLVRVREDSVLPAFCRMFAKYMAQYVVDDDARVHVYQ